MPQTTRSASIEDYLKAIYDLTASGKRASTNALAKRLDVTPASITGMIKRLSTTKPPLIKYEKHRGVVLTGDGEAVALKIIRNHRLLELFLQRTLGYTWDEVHAEADRLEHVISDEMEERIAIALGNPSHDPHGEPIPTRDLQLPPVSKDRLSESRPGDHVKVERVEAADLDLLRYLGELGLTPDAEVKILGYSIYDENLHMQVKGQPQPVVLGPRITRQIYVKVIK